LYPVHNLMFGNMLNAIAAACREEESPAQ
jgi:hypothetical protein